MTLKKYYFKIKKKLMYFWKKQKQNQKKDENLA